jgi:hypothetical protein
MTRCRDQDAGDDGWEDNETGYGDDPDEEPTVPCPYCKQEILKHAPPCPYCERHVSKEGHSGPRMPLWGTVTAFTCLAVALWWVLISF